MPPARRSPSSTNMRGPIIERSPFLCIGTADAEGNADVSPRGDPPGFVRVIDDQTIIIPDRPGNNRADTMQNIIANPKVGILFLIPGIDDTLRLNGRAEIIDDPEALAARRRQWQAAEARHPGQSGRSLLPLRQGVPPLETVGSRVA